MAAPVAQSPEVLRMVEALRLQESEEGRWKGYHFKPRKDDVMIVSPAKCGTTWVCQIVQSLRSRGDMDFEEINLAIPCLEMAWDGGYGEPDQPQRWQPRVFKTHWWEPDCPKGAGKHIYIVRDPMEAGPSFFHFMKGWAFDEGDISLDQFILEFFMWRGDAQSPLQNASQWSNMASWYPRRRDPDLLWLHYEDLHQDRAAAVALIAAFLGLEDPERQAAALEQSSIEFMKAHPTKYDEHHLKQARNLHCGRPEDAGMTHASSGKVRDGVLGSNRAELSARARAALQQRWTDYMLPRTGYATYEEMRRGINRELRRPFKS